MNRVAVVTGGTAGVGRATAVAFAERGYDVAVLARGADGLECASKELRDLGARALAISVDVSDADAVERAADEIEQRLGPIRVWVNCAMVTVFAPVAKMTPAEYRRVTEVTYLGTVHGTLAALRCMKARNEGAIVQVGSALSYRAIPLQSAYCGSKFAIRGFTDSLRSELIHDKSRIRLSMVQLPGMNTPQFEWARNKLAFEPQPLPPIFAPRVAAEAVVYAAEHRRREIFVAWPSVKAIVGNKFLPGLGDRLLAHEAYSGQESSILARRDKADNLTEPVPGLHREEGRFTDREKKVSPLLWLDLNRGAIAAAAVAAAASLVLVLSREPQRAASAARIGAPQRMN